MNQLDFFQHLVDATRLVRKELASIPASAPPGVEVTIARDYARIIEDQVESVLFDMMLAAGLVIVVVLVFFPIFINTAMGLTQVEPSQLELMESYAAGKWTITREVRIPNAMPFFFTALKLSTSLAVIAAIVAEYFGGRQDALGPLITQSAGLTRYA